MKCRENRSDVVVVKFMFVFSLAPAFFRPYRMHSIDAAYCDRLSVCLSVCVCLCVYWSHGCTVQKA